MRREVAQPATRNPCAGKPLVSASGIPCPSFKSSLQSYCRGVLNQKDSALKHPSNRALTRFLVLVYSASGQEQGPGFARSNWLSPTGKEPIGFDCDYRPGESADSLDISGEEPPYPGQYRCNETHRGILEGDCNRVRCTQMVLAA